MVNCRIRSIKSRSEGGVVGVVGVVGGAVGGEGVVSAPLEEQEQICRRCCVRRRKSSSRRRISRSHTTAPPGHHITADVPTIKKYNWPNYIIATDVMVEVHKNTQNSNFFE